jgi:TonB family protein
MPISGKLSNEQIQGAVNANIKAFDTCYTLGADKATGKLEGTVTLKATVGPHGDVNDAEVTKSTTKNAKVDACVLDAFKKIKFPKPEGGGTTIITYPMTFGGEMVTTKK